ncbi:hypothetical protein HOD38_04260 [archaeon]|jgi:hypothetical protein|nr:hypothetical protein [archaeon]MBT4397455.1 hypothetical protein [archaeon]MBT4440527.1 hypothetical protein [archaeon]
MPKILLTGLPRVGKTSLVEHTHGLVDGVENISLGDLISYEMKRLGHATARLPFVSFDNQELLRAAAVYNAGRQLRDVNYMNVVLDTPMTLYSGSGVPNVVMTSDQMRMLFDDGDGFDYVVTLIDDADTLAGIYADEPYPTDPTQILNWIAFEIDAAMKIPPAFEDNDHTPIRRLVIPRGHSDTTLAKLLVNPNPVVGYLGFPITDLKPEENYNPTSPHYGSRAGWKAREDAKPIVEARIATFRDRLQYYSAVIVPMTLSDSRAADPIEMEHTIHRDIHLFAARSDFMIAYFPDERFGSTGVMQEMGHMKEFGKRVIMIHPNYQEGGKVFGFRPTLGFRSEEEFFAAVANSPDPRFDNTPYAFLRTMWNLESMRPMYQNLIK